MRTSGRRRPSDARRRVAGSALWRVVTAAPGVLGSLLMLVSAGLGRWAARSLLAWAAGLAVLMTRVGERMTVRAICRFHRPSPVQAAALQLAWSTALRVTKGVRR